MVDWVGTTGNDNRTIGHGTDGYGLQGDDTLRSANFATVGLIGGSGNDTYIHGNRALTTIVEFGNSPFDKFIEAPSSTLYAFFATIDGRHLTMSNAYGTEGVVIIDWQDPANRIESWQLASGATYSFEGFRNFVYSSPAYIGDVSMEWVYGPELTAAINYLVEYVRYQGAYLEDLAAQPSPHQTINGTAGPDILDGDWGNDTIHGFSGDDTIRGMDGNDTVYGDDGNDDVNGNLGNDRVHGGPGQDFVRGGQGNDAVYGQEDDDWHVNGNIGNDSVYGGTGNDNVFGGPGDDTLYGEVGNDVLSGDLGNDRLYGGPGADHFVFHQGAGWDLILDFKRSEGDKILVQAGINGTGIMTGQQLYNATVSDGGNGWIVDLGNGDKIGIVNAPRPGADDFWIV